MMPFDEKRRAYRMKFSGAVQLQTKDAKYFTGCSACDISESGIRLTVGQFFTPGTDILLDIKLYIDKVVNCLGSVVWVKKLAFVDRYQVGIQFSGSESLIFKEAVKGFAKEES